MRPMLLAISSGEEAGTMYRPDTSLMGLVREGYVDMENGNDREDTLDVYSTLALLENILARLEAIERRLDTTP